jgi:hypothetical protein
MAKRVLDEIMTGINAKKAKRIGKKVVEHDKEETTDDSECPSTPVKSKPRSEPVVMSKTPKERATGKGTRRSLILDRCNFLASSEAELDSSKSSSDDGSSSEPDERSHTRKGKAKVLSYSTKENISPSTSAGKQSDPSKQCDDSSELSKTNALLHTLLKRIERQDKKISDMQSKLSRSSSASTDSTPRRRSASDRRKEVPLEVRVSPQYSFCSYISLFDCTYYFTEGD